ncbi:poly [ADP-ribose] polymerase 14-like isoform X3, partial [Clarias magur]
WTYFGATEVIVAVLKCDDQIMKFNLRHGEFMTLRPHVRRTGEAIECYIRAVLTTEDKAGRINQLNHYSMSSILHGSREQMARQGFPKVSFDAYDGIIGALNIKDTHWRFVRGTDEIQEAKDAALRFG